MSKGVLMFSLNNEKIHYNKLAVYSAKRIKKFLNVPVAVVTDNIDDLTAYDKNNFIDNKIFIDDTSKNFRNFYNGKEYDIRLSWKNTTRNYCYDLSPFDETLVIDVDYIVNSPILNYCWNNTHEFLIYNDSFNFSGEKKKYLNEFSIPFYWATVFYFKKTENTKYFFTFIEHIKTNWNYYRLIYNISDKKFRNDYAFSIALNLFQNLNNSLPGKLYYSYDTDHVIEITENYITLLIDKDNSYIPIKIENLDLHLMNKFNLMEKIKND